MERTVTLQKPGCIYEGTIMHELLHALGRYTVNVDCLKISLFKKRFFP